jgi:Icc protein
MTIHRSWDSHRKFHFDTSEPARNAGKAITKAGALPQKPAFMIHTGDITHLSKPEEFDNADQVISKVKLDTFYVPGGT